MSTFGPEKVIFTQMKTPTQSATGLFKERKFIAIDETFWNEQTADECLPILSVACHLYLLLSDTFLVTSDFQSVPF